MCHVKFYGRNAGVDINFIDIPGEWFINAEFESKVKDVLRSSQILLIAIDSPHLMEAEGKYHEIYNRAEVITEQIKQAFQGSLEPRMVLFVPMKCEKYKNRGRMKELTDRVLEGYEELITYLTAAGDGRLYTVAISPCITMGGCEFLRFVLPTDEEGNYETDENGEILPDISIDPATGHRIMNWRAQYRYLTDEDGDHYYEPKDCEQPLLYLLTYYTRILHLQCQNGGWWQGIWAFIRKQANVQQILNGQNLIGEKIKRDAEAGFKVLHDPLEAF